MPSALNSAKLAAMIRTKRGDRGIRSVASEIPVSPATLSRVEQGKLPDVDTFLLLCKWLKVPSSDFALERENDDGAKVGQSTAELVEAHLRADRTLSAETTEALVQMIRLAYKKENRQQ